MSLTQQSIKGAFWFGALRVGIKIFSFLKLVIVARILSPYDFGLFGMITIPYGLLEVATEPGMNQAMIQSKKNIQPYFSSAQLIFFSRGLSLFIILYLTAPLISRFFQADLTQAVRIISLAPLARGFINPATVLFRKQLNFQREFFFQLIASVAESLAAIYFAIKLKSMLALPYAVLFGAVTSAVLSYLLCKFAFSKISFNRIKELYRYGKWVTLGTMASYLNDQGDDLVVSKVLGAEPLGLYQNAYKISNLPTTQGASLIYQVVFPIFSQIQADFIRLKRGVIKSLLVTLALSFTFGAAIFLAAPYLINIFLGAKWQPMLPALNILIIFGMVRPLISVGSAFFDSIGCPRISSTQALIKLIILAILVYPFTKTWGIIGTAWTVVIAQISVLPWFSYQLLKTFKTYEKTS